MVAAVEASESSVAGFEVVAVVAGLEFLPLVEVIVAGLVWAVLPPVAVL